MKEQKEYKGFTIYYNRVPDIQFDYGGFGWTFGVTLDDPQNRIFVVVVKCQHSADEETIQQVYNLGEIIVYKRIDTKDFVQGGYYCYWWNHNSGAEEASCDDVSPGIFRS